MEPFEFVVQGIAWVVLIAIVWAIIDAIARGRRKANDEAAGHLAREFALVDDPQGTSFSEWRQDRDALWEAMITRNRLRSSALAGDGSVSMNTFEVQNATFEAMKADFQRKYGEESVPF